MNDELSRKLIIIAVVVIVILIVMFLLIGFCQNPHQKPSKKNHHHEVLSGNPLDKKERFQVEHQMEKSCDCTKPCDCKKKKKDHGGYCPQCPTCATCPECPSMCPQQCPQCSKCGGGIGGNCEMNTDCASGLRCDQGECVCPTPNPPSNLTATPVFDQAGPGFRLQIAWSPVTGANLYNIIISGPSPQTYFNYTGTSVTTPLLLPGTYSIKVFAGTTQCGTSEISSNVSEIVVSPVPNGICARDNQCPTNQFCFQGTCAYFT